MPCLTPSENVTLPTRPEPLPKFTDGKLTLHNIAQDEASLRQYVQKKLRYVKAMGILINNNANWQGVMVQIWSSMVLNVEQFLRALAKTKTRQSYKQ